MSPADDKPAPRRSDKGRQKADEKYARQAAALRANLKRRSQQRRGQEDETPAARKPDPE